MSMGGSFSVSVEEMDGDVPELILERLEILESLDSEEPLRPEGREAAAG